MKTHRDIKIGDLYIINGEPAVVVEGPFERSAFGYFDFDEKGLVVHWRVMTVDGVSLMRASVIIPPNDRASDSEVEK